MTQNNAMRAHPGAAQLASIGLLSFAAIAQFAPASSSTQTREHVTSPPPPAK